VKFKPKFAAKHVGHLVQQNSPTLLSALAVLGVGATGYFTFKATWQAREEISKAEMSAIADGTDSLTRQEQALKVWKLYIPAAGVGAATIGCIVASNRIQVRRLAAMAAAYGVLSGDFDEYRNKALEALGDKKAKEIDDKVAEEKMKKTPPPVGIPLEDGQSWFCDLSTMRYFKSTRGDVEKARNDLNYSMAHGGCMYATLNEAYSFMGLATTNVGDSLGWTNEQQVDIVFTPVFMPNGDTATGFKFTPEPAPDFDDLH
jgi:hypothetical protein